MGGFIENIAAMRYDERQTDKARIRELEAALRKQVEWFDAEERHVNYDSDGGAHWRHKLRLAQEAETMAREALTAVEPVVQEQLKDSTVASVPAQKED